MNRIKDGLELFKLIVAILANNKEKIQAHH